ALQTALATSNDPQTRSRVEAQLEEAHRQEAGHTLRYSFAGRLGRALEPVIAPLGYDWKIGIGIVGSFAAREVFVSTMSLVYNVGKVEDAKGGKATQTLAATI